MITISHALNLAFSSVQKYIGESDMPQQQTEPWQHAFYEYELPNRKKLPEEFYEF